LAAQSAWAAAGEAIRIESPQAQATLVELYTSEGCSSCPPADRWLSGLKGDSRLWKTVVPVAFHVDYWNYLGWSDRFSSRFFSERQRSYAEYGRVRTVYTPGFVVNGEEWKGWFRRQALPIEDRPGAGRLAAEGDDESLRVVYEPQRVAGTGLRLQIARLGFDLDSEVVAGENRGRRLRHDFVVLGFAEHELVFDEGRYTASLRLPPSREPAAREAVALWVTQPGNPRPLQAAGGWLGH
jgi:hypothetical protein